MKKITKILSAAGAAVVLCTTAFSAGTLVSINVDPSIKILVNGEEFRPTDVNGNEVMTFTYDGTTYAPLRALAEAYGLEVGYDSDRKMATVGYYAEDTYGESSYDGEITDRMNDALNTAIVYLKIMHFSRHALSGQLQIEGFTSAEADYAVDNCGADWNEQALLKAEEMVSDGSNYSAMAVKEMLLSNYGYTGDEAEFAVQNCGADWNESALSAARSYMRMGYSADEIAAILADDGYTSENILYALDNIE